MQFQFWLIRVVFKKRCSLQQRRNMPKHFERFLLCLKSHFCGNRNRPVYKYVFRFIFRKIKNICILFETALNEIWKKN